MNRITAISTLRCWCYVPTILLFLLCGLHQCFKLHQSISHESSSSIILSLSLLLLLLVVSFLSSSLQAPCCFYLLCFFLAWQSWFWIFIQQSSFAPKRVNLRVPSMLPMNWSLRSSLTPHDITFFAFFTWYRSYELTRTLKETSPPPKLLWAPNSPNLQLEIWLNKPR